MKIVKQTQYIADDGEIFTSEKKCKAYENIANRLEKLFSCFPPLPKRDNCNFENGCGYIQHDASTFNAVLKEFTRMAQKHHNMDYEFNTYGFGRTLSDNGSVFCKYFSRLSNTDPTTCKEYGQMYYRFNPQHIRKNVRINK